jgi:hypothetical protein
VVHIDDLIKPCLEQIVLTAVPPLLRPHRITSLLLIRSEENHGQRCRSICKKIRAQAVKTGKYEYLQWPKTYARSNPFEIFTENGFFRPVRAKSGAAMRAEQSC